MSSLPDGFEQISLFEEEVTPLTRLKQVCKVCQKSFRPTWKDDTSLICEGCQKNEEPNPMRRHYGAGPDGAKCKTCKHLFGKRFDKTYWKCALRKNTNGSATDHRVRWNACAKYEEDEDAS